MNEEITRAIQERGFITASRLTQEERDIINDWLRHHVPRRADDPASVPDRGLSVHDCPLFQEILRKRVLQ